jgi:hypothetical protein
MKHSNLAVFILLSLFMWHCSTSDRATGREVKKETADKRKSPIILAAKQGDYYLNLRENHFFDYFGLDSATKKASLYAGNYELKGDSLLMAFYNNYQPADLTNTGFMDRGRNQIVLFAKDPSKNRRMDILLTK